MEVREMNSLQKMMRNTGPVRVGKSFAVACALAASFGVGLTASGNALAQQFAPLSTGAMPAQIVTLVDVRNAYRMVEDQRSSFNVSRLVGGSLGGLAANSLTKGQGNGQTAATIIGAALGQAIGDSVDEGLSQHKVAVLELTFVRPGDRSGQVYVLLQDANESLAECKPGMSLLLLNMRGTEMASRCLVSPANLASVSPERMRTIPSQEEAKALFDRISAPVSGSGRYGKVSGMGL